MSLCKFPTIAFTNPGAHCSTARSVPPERTNSCRKSARAEKTHQLVRKNRINLMRTQRLAEIQLVRKKRTNLRGKSAPTRAKKAHVRKRRTTLCGKSARIRAFRAEKAHECCDEKSRAERKTPNFEGGYLARSARCGAPLRVQILEI